MRDVPITDPETAAGAAPPGAPGGAGNGRWPSRDSMGAGPHEGTWMHKFVLRWGSWLVRSYYRLEMRGEPFPESAPVLLVQNHTNGLCDAHFLMSSTTRPIRILVKYKLMKTPLIGWMLRGMQAVPMYRKKDGVDTRKNASSFESIDQALRERTVIGLFPEGESLNAIHLRELRSGVARMAVSAVDSSEAKLGLLIVPIGVTYEDRDRFRTRASAIIGPPIDVDRIIEPVGTDNMRTASKALMVHVRESMSALIFNAESEEEYRAVASLERLLESDDAPLGIRQRAAAASLRGDTGPGAEDRRRLITELGTSLAKARLSGDEVLAERPGLGETFGHLFLLLPLFVLGLVVWCVPIALALTFAAFRKTPDKLVTLRVLGGFTGFILWPLALVALLGTAYGPAGALGAVALVGVGFNTFIWTWDRLLAVRARFVRRALHRRPEEARSLADAIHSIRRRYSGAAETDQA